MRRFFFTGAVLSLVALPLACEGVQNSATQVVARTVMVGTLLSTPATDVPLNAFVDPVSALPFDFRVTVPAQAAAFVYLGTRVGENPDTPPIPINDATVSMVSDGGVSVGLTFDTTADGGGQYSKTSVDASNLKYEVGGNYEFHATAGDQTYVGAVEKAPAPERIDSFHPAKGFFLQASGTPFTFTRPTPPAGQDRNLGFVYVFPIDQNGQAGPATYSTLPETPLKYIELIAGPGGWKTTEVTIPGTAFPFKSQAYAVTFTSVKTGGPKSGNLFTGSAILAGTSDVAIVRTLAQ